MVCTRTLKHMLYFSLCGVNLYEFCNQPSERSLDVLHRLLLLFSEAGLANGKRQFVCKQQVVGLIAQVAGWKKSSLLSVECLLQRQSSSPDKEQQ